MTEGVPYSLALYFRGLLRRAVQEHHQSISLWGLLLAGNFYAYQMRAGTCFPWYAEMMWQESRKAEVRRRAPWIARMLRI